MKRKELQENYGEGCEEVIINPANKKRLKGEFFGDDECFDLYEFYQYFLSEGVLYKAFYKTPASNDFGDIDYKKPYRLDITNDYDDLFV